jgi:hypothetical protein
MNRTDRRAEERYIDADKLCEGLKNMAIVQEPYKQSTILGVVSSIENFPTADVAPRPEWISVEERLPERMKPVLVLATSRYEEDGYDVLIAYHDGGEWEEQCVHSHECTVFYIYADVKFWMPLPEKQKGGCHE